jgi:hypothetical protein
LRYLKRPHTLNGQIRHVGFLSLHEARRWPLGFASDFKW